MRISEAEATLIALILRANRQHGGGNHRHHWKHPLRCGEALLVGRAYGTGIVVAASCGGNVLTQVVGAGIAAGARPDSSWGDVEPWGHA